MKRKIPTFRVDKSKGGSYSQLVTLPGIREAVIKEAVEAIKDGIKRNKSTVSLFEITYSDYYVDLAKDEWKSTLENSIEYFIEKEEYPKCIEIRDLIKKL